MPRIVVAIMVVVTIGASIAINTARFPVVWKMVGAPSEGVSTRRTVPSPAAAPPVSREPAPVDLSDVAPPPIRGDVSDYDVDTTRVPQLPLPDAPTPRDDNVESAYPSPDSHSMYLVSEPSGDAARRAENVDQQTGPNPAWMDERRDTDESVSDNASHRGQAPKTAVANMAPPISFGPATGASSNTVAAQLATNRRWASRESLGVGTSSIDSNEPTTWPAQMAPILKFGNKPLIAGGDAGDAQAERPLVPIDWPDDKPAADPRPEPPLLSVERLPKVVPTEKAAPWDEPRRLPDSIIPIYPSTGK
ncbi:MAG: hypothetical protein JW888_11650 [Pirellulales bacterium]|nr:hypothetical protein [Pirellulales bacterium]